MPGSAVWRAIFRFELRHQLRQPLFALVTVALAVLLFLAGADSGAGGASGRLHVNAPAVIIEQLMKWIYLVLFLLTAFVASAAVRDFERRTHELFFSRPISCVDYITARFAGTMVVCTLPYIVGVMALAAGTFMPGLDPARVGPFSMAPYAFALGVLVIPTLLALGATFYAVATWTRSTRATYVVVVAFFALSATAGMLTPSAGRAWVGQLLDPFGVTALASTLKYWTVAELNRAAPSVAGMLLWNRLCWLALGFSALGAAVLRFDPSRHGLFARTSRAARVSEPAPAPLHTAPVHWVRTTASAGARTFTQSVVARQFVTQLRRDVVSTVGSLPFAGMLVLALVLLVQTANEAGNLFGMPVHPRTSLMLDAMQGGFSVVLLLAVVLCSGELIGRERAAELNEVMDAMPTPSGVYLGAKVAALAVMVLVMLCAGVLALAAFQRWQGYTDVEPWLYLRGAAMAGVYPLLMLVFACCCHVVARNRLGGYGLVILFIVVWDVLEEFGFEHHLYRYGSLPPVPYSDFAGYGPFAAPFAWFSLYWAFGALVLLGVSLLLWPRGTDTAWRSRLTVARARFGGVTRTLVLAGAVGMAGTGAFVFVNTNVRNAYVPSTAAAAQRAEYERAYRRYQGLPLPRITAVQASVDIFPEQRRVTMRGQYQLRNRTTQPLRDVHVSLPAQVRRTALTLPAHDVILDDSARGYAIYRLRAPLASGDSMTMTFSVTLEHQGFVNNGTDVSIIDNGTYFTKRDLFPVIGYDEQRQLTDADARRRHDLPVLRLAGSDDVAARQTNPRASDADRVAFDCTLSTRIDQIAVTSGALEREWVEGGRRYFQYVAEAPITHHVAFASARYAVSRSDWHGVAVEIYHLPSHDTNISRMMKAARASLDYYSEQFGPYQHRQLRIVEVPGYVRDATAFPGMIAESESMAFTARLDGAEAIDHATYITAHEIAHQWFGQQLLGAQVQGTGTLHETLAQYAAQQVMARTFGDAGVRRVLGFEHEWYLRGRGRERGAEPSLARVERQEYVYYHKGALAMHALAAAAGEAGLNHALAEFLARSRGGPPYATIDQLLPLLRSAMPSDAGHLVDDLFTRTVLYQTSVSAATVTARADGMYLVRLEVHARKLETDSSGAERARPLDDWIDIALMASDARAPNGEGMLVTERRRLRTSPATFEFLVRERPARVLLDPYYHLADRDRGDNGREVVIAEAR
jgi:ABC-type transport system involved in multi-copper enzyme maturation permease subunit